MHKDIAHALITPDRLDDAARRWRATGTELQFLRAMENFVYAFERDGQPLILRFTHSTHRSATEVAAELDFVDYLARQGVDVAHPVPSLDDRLIETLTTEESQFHVAVFKRAPGDKPKLDATDPTLANLHEDWGAMIGKMHRAIPGYRNGQPDPRRHNGIEDDITRNARRYLPAKAAHVADLLDELLDEVKRFPRSIGQFGLLHTDCHHGNFHVVGRQLTLFDFDDCCHQWFAYDLAVPIWHYPVRERGQDMARDRAIVTDFFRRFLTGYSKYYNFDPSWIQQLPIFFRLRDIQLFVFSYKMQPNGGFEAGMQDFMRRRLALIESRQPSVQIDWNSLGL